MESTSLPDQYARAKEELVTLGIPEREASIYFTLLARGESKASELASKLNLHRLDVYHDLKSLQGKDMVEATISKPMKFRALPLRMILQILENSQKAQYEARSTALSDLRKISEILVRHQSLPGDPGNKIQIIGGRKPINDKWSSL